MYLLLFKEIEVPFHQVFVSLPDGYCYGKKELHKYAYSEIRMMDQNIEETISDFASGGSG